MSSISAPAAERRMDQRSHVWVGIVANLVLALTAAVLTAVTWVNWGSDRTFAACFAIAAVLCTLCLWLKTAHKLNAALLIVSIAGLIYGIELIFVLTGPSAAREARQSGRDFDARTLWEVAEDLRSQGKRAYPGVSPGMMLGPDPDSSAQAGTPSLLPTSGISNSTIVLGAESGKYVIYESDEHGFHNPKGLWQPGILSIATVGSSYAEGCCVPSDQGFVGLIRKSHPGTLNVALHSNGPLLELATLEEYLTVLRPRIVLWCASENELYYLKNERGTALMNYLKAGFRQDLLDRQAEADAMLIAFAESARRSQRLVLGLKQKLPRGMQSAMVETLRLAMLTRLRSLFSMVYQGRPGDAEYELLTRVIEKAKTSTEAWGGRFYFVYLPVWDGVARSDEASRQGHDRIAKLLERLGVPMIDVSTSFRASGDPTKLFFYARSHYNEKGHQVVADAVLRRLATDGVLP